MNDRLYRVSFFFFCSAAPFSHTESTVSLTPATQKPGVESPKLEKKIRKKIVDAILPQSDGRCQGIVDRCWNFPTEGETGGVAASRKPKSKAAVLKEVVHFSTNFHLQ